MMTQYSWLIIPFVFFFSPSYTTAYTWQFTSDPAQCQNLSVAVNGSGQPPYSFVIIPNGNSPLPNGIEVRSVQTYPFPGNSTSLTFNLNYPENSSFVAVVTDSSGSGTGVVSTPVTVLKSSDSSCYNPTQTIHPPWTFNVQLELGITQCDSVRWWWLPGAVNGTVQFYGIIPGGNFFALPETLTTENTTGTGFEWTINIPGGTNILIIAGDDRGIGSGGYVGYTVSYSSNTTCLNNASPSSTAGTPPGSYPTGTKGGSNGGSGKSSDAGPIAGGVVGGLALIVAVALIAFFYARRGKNSVAQERPVNVLNDDEDENGPHNLPHHYAPEPFLGSDRSTSEATSSAGDRPLPKPPGDFSYPQGLTAAATSMRKGALPGQGRPVNIIQHDDAGPSGGPSGAGQPETIELPPAYGNIRAVQRYPSTAPTTGSTVTHTETMSI
ncbi:hypothetical protein EI94DRAFT_1829083 [Lactarius quietus]|nr:hypothetical protein EI94DRAFT_1829083 [Lactarius quietus]